MNNTQPLIMLENVSKTYELKKKQVTGVQEINLCVDLGEFLVITGRSGCGKTTLLNLISGLARPTGGRVLLEQIEVWKLPDAQQAHLRNQKIGFIFQFPSLMPSLSALENVILPTIAWKNGHQFNAEARAAALLEEVGLSDKLHAYPRQLSAGQQQRVVIARSLINHPELLLADEPTSNLDEQTEHEIMALIRKIHKDKGITILLVTHAPDLTRYGTRAIRMANGRIIQGELAYQ